MAPIYRFRSDKEGKAIEITMVIAAAQEVLCRAHPSAGACLNAHGQLLLLHQNKLRMAFIQTSLICTSDE
jgi:hypothetical protein